jgi:hypothetical protein|tara:strand:+ start:4030 stop:4740 length:711 start_codon:yes stop_codon:yes gene_type:complete
MATSVATITTGTMSAAVIKARQSSVKAWINGGMVVGDLQTDSWAGPEYVFGPEFFGTPAPMARMTFGDVHWRSRSQDRSKGHHQHPEFRTVDGSNWIPIDGLQATVGIDQASDVKLTACYYVFVNNGTPASSSDDTDPEETEVARFQVGYYEEYGDTLSLQANSQRSVYGSGATTSANTNSRISSKYIHQTWYFENLSAGLYHFGVRSNLVSSDTDVYRNLFVDSRNLTIKIFPKA